MNKLIIAATIGLSCVVVSSAQAPPPARPAAPKSTPAPPQAPVPDSPAAARASGPPAGEPTATAAHDLSPRYCVGCHSEKAKAAGMDSSRKLTIDNIDFTNVHPQAQKLEMMIRKMRAGM